MTSPAQPTDWQPASWRGKPAAQQPSYPDAAALDATLTQLARLPPLVTSWEIENLRRQLADAARGERFLLQGGDCSENFHDCESDSIASKLKILLQMSLVLVHASRKPVIRVGRFAGQYAKPRSADLETRAGVTLPAYRGDMVNCLGFTPAERIPDPTLLLRAYERSSLTLNFIRSLIDGGFADLQAQRVAIRGRLRKHRGVLDAGHRYFLCDDGSGRGRSFAADDTEKSRSAKKCEENDAQGGGGTWQFRTTAFHGLR